MGITNILFHNKLFPHEVEMMTLIKKYCEECSKIIIRYKIFFVRVHCNTNIHYLIQNGQKKLKFYNNSCGFLDIKQGWLSEKELINHTIFSR